MFIAIAVRDIGQSRLLRTPKYREKSVSFNVGRYTMPAAMEFWRRRQGRALTQRESSPVLTDRARE